MSKKSVVLLTLLAVLPLLAFAWLGWRLSRSESLHVQQQLRLLLTERIDEENRKVQRYFAGLQRELSQGISQYGDDANALREWARQSPVIRQTIVLDEQGRLVHPRLDLEMNRDEQAFLTEIQQLLLDKDLVRLAFPRPTSNGGPAMSMAESARLHPTRPTPRPPSAKSLRFYRSTISRGDNQSQVPAMNEGWSTWYFGRGVNLMYWRRWSDERVTIVAVTRARWIADLLTLLPSTSTPSANSSSESPGRIQLVDSSDQLVYQWGSFQPAMGAIPIVDEPLVAPLSSWRFKYFVDPAAYSRFGRLPIVASLAGLACALIGLVVTLYRDYARDMLEARQRVNFVNQVSHELKTPLTNIRLYTDLLQRDLEHLPDQQQDKPLSRVEAIASESQRLTRLIANVLTFARSERNQLELHLQRIDLDELVRAVVERLRPLLQSHKMELQLATNAGQPLWLDPDAIEQILDNLVSNAVRYASHGKFVSIRTSSDADQVMVEVSDRGPGIGTELSQTMFEPFVRGASGLSDATGTGIGLSISRRLARLHGGDLTLEPSDHGSTFRLTLPRRNNHDRAARGR